MFRLALGLSLGCFGCFQLSMFSNQRSAQLDKRRSALMALSFR
jgi:hypothetical protein